MRNITSLTEAIELYNRLNSNMHHAFIDYDNEKISMNELTEHVYRVDGYPFYSTDNGEIRMSESTKGEFIKWLFEHRISSEAQNNPFSIY